MILCPDDPTVGENCPDGQAEETVTPAAEDTADPAACEAGEPKKGGNMKKRTRFLLAFAGILLIFCLVGGIMFQTALLPLTAEAGTPPPKAEAFLRWQFLPAKVLDSLTEEKMGAIGTHTVRFSLCGIARETTLTVADTQPPVFTLRDIAVLSGAPVAAEDFVQTADDFSAFSYTADIPSTDTPGTVSVRLTFTDAAGNTASGTARMTVHPLSSSITVEAGITADALKEVLAKQLPEAVPDSSLGKTDLTTPGERPISVEIDGTRYTVMLTVEDTVPPTAAVGDMHVLMGTEVRPEDFLHGITDATEVTASFDGEAPDTSAAGSHTVSLLLTDAAGNTAAFSTYLHVLPLSAVYTAEAGTPFIEFFVSLPLDLAKASIPQLPDVSVLYTGEYTLPILTPHGTFDILVQVRDTTAPSAIGCTVVYQLGSAEEPQASDFVTGIRDASAVTVSFAVPPDLTMLGNQPVTVRLTDAAGNTADIRATVSVQNDREAPLIRGVKNLTAYVGGTVSYKSGVTAVDGGKSVPVTVDASRVNLKVPGTYTVYYSATDEAGNTASVSASVTVSEITYDVISEKADAILKKILKSGMTNRQKARAIYDWMKANVSYVAYPDKTYWMRAAYHGFLNGRGDCYVFYAMTRILLDRAGIENMEISRDDPDNPHFWNLVNCGDGWYHLDTCPHYRQYPLESFMLTDDEVKAYSDTYVKDYYSFDGSLYPATP